MYKYSVRYILPVQVPAHYKECFKKDQQPANEYGYGYVFTLPFKSNMSFRPSCRTRLVLDCATTGDHVPPSQEARADARQGVTTLTLQIEAVNRTLCG